jgi:acetyltransferase
VADADNETAEFAILVGDQWQGKGLGNKFMDLAMQIAEKRNIKKVCATVLNANVTMLHMFRKRGFSIQHYDEDSSYAEKLLKSD